MTLNNENLYIFEAIALRDEYDSHIKLLQNILNEPEGRKGGFLIHDSVEKKTPVDDFQPDEYEEALKKLRTKRLKLNQEIQAVNFNSKFDFEGENISIAEALEIRKNLRYEIDTLSAKTVESAYSVVIHKEERDIVNMPRYSFKGSYSDFQKIIKRLRKLERAIHIANHNTTVAFKDE